MDESTGNRGGTKTGSSKKPNVITQFPEMHVGSLSNKSFRMRICWKKKFNGKTKDV